MARTNLQLKAAVTINAEGTEVYIEFLDATGVYDVDDNPGGFGPPNPTRNSVAVVIYAAHKKVAGDVVATVLAHNPLSVTSFTVTMTKEVNGVLNYNLFALPIFDSGGSYDDGDVVFDNENPSAPFIKKMIEGDWVERTAAQLIGDTNVDQLNDYAFPISAAIELCQDLNGIKMKKLRDFVNDDCGKDDYEPKRNNYEYVDGLLQSATNAFCAQAYNEAQIDIEEIFRFEESLVDNG